jgi:ABC-type multidrug transport system ATPase subunit
MIAILETRSVTMQINGATLVDGIDLQVNHGEMVAMQAGPQRHSGDRNPARP